MDISAMDPQNIQQLFDAEVVGPEGEAIGTVEQIFADDVTGAPTFVTVKDAATADERFLPVSGADYNRNRVEVPFSKDVVEAAPSANGGEDLSPERESEVYGYYGIRAPRRSRQEEPEPLDDWGEEAEFTPAPDAPDEAPQDAAEPDAREDSATQEVPDDATATTALGQDEPQFDRAAQAEDPATDFRSDVEIDEQADAAVPEPDAASADENPAEETAVLSGGSFPDAATSAGLVTAGAGVGARAHSADDAVATGDPDATLDADDQGLQADTAVDEEALATDRIDGESPEAAREDELPVEEDDASAEALEQDNADGPESGAEPGTRGAAASTIPGLPEGARLRKYVVTEMVTVQVPVRREVVCWVDAEGGIHELETVDAPDSARQKDLHDPATWWFGSEDATGSGPDAGTGPQPHAGGGADDGGAEGNDTPEA